MHLIFLLVSESLKAKSKFFKVCYNQPADLKKSVVRNTFSRNISCKNIPTKK